MKYGPGRFRTLLTHISVMIPTDQSSDIGSEPIKLRINRSVNNEPLVGWNGIQCVELDVISTLVVWEGNEQADGPFVTLSSRRTSDGSQFNPWPRCDRGFVPLDVGRTTRSEHGQWTGCRAWSSAYGKERGCALYYVGCRCMDCAWWDCQPHLSFKGRRRGISVSDDCKGNTDDSSSHVYIQHSTIVFSQPTQWTPHRALVDQSHYR